jgi:hypothetical protein
MKICVCQPTGDMVYTDMMSSLIAAQAYVYQTSNHKLTFINEKNSLLQVSRHRLVCHALGYKPDALLWIDSDMVFSYDLITRLADSGKDIIGINAVRRYPPHTSCGLNLDGTPINYDQTGIGEVEKIGLGCLLVAAKVYKDIGMPYYRVPYTNEVHIGEDFDFCTRVKEKGYKVYCHHDLSKKVYHLGVTPHGKEISNSMPNVS